MLGDRSENVIVVPSVPEAAVGEDAGPSLGGMIVEGQAAFLVFEFAEQVSFELLKRSFIVVAGLWTVGIAGEPIGFGFDDDSSAGKIQVGVTAGRLVGDAVLDIERVEKSGDVLSNVVFVARSGRVEKLLRSLKLYVVWRRHIRT